jgi:hypothetical protein
MYVFRTCEHSRLQAGYIPSRPQSLLLYHQLFPTTVIILASESVWVHKSICAPWENLLPVKVTESWNRLQKVCEVSTDRPSEVLHRRFCQPGRKGLVQINFWNVFPSNDHWILLSSKILPVILLEEGKVILLESSFCSGPCHGFPLHSN